jgi:hypothetical protein
MPARVTIASELLWRDALEAHAPAERVAEGGCDLGMGHGRKPGDGVRLAHVTVFGQRGRCDRGDVPGVYDADRRVPDRRRQRAVRDRRREREVSLQDQV